MIATQKRARDGRFMKTKQDYLVYESERQDGRCYMWLSIQHISLALPGHNPLGYAIQHSSGSATYLLPVTIVAAINHREAHNSDYAAYIGIGAPHLTEDRARVAYISQYGNKIEGALAEHLFRTALDKRFGRGVIRYRA